VREFGRLLRDLQLDQIASLARLVHQKLETLDALERLTADRTQNERAVHEIFDLNPWLPLSRVIASVQ
jgi:hypothetical protein